MTNFFVTTQVFNPSPGERVRTTRRALGLSQSDLAALSLPRTGKPLASSDRTVRRWEDGPQEVPGAVMTLLVLLAESPEARRLMGLSQQLRVSRVVTVP